MPTRDHGCDLSPSRPTAADNHAEREAQVDEIVARMRRIEIDANKPPRTVRP